MLYGFAMAYLLSPIVNWLERLIRLGWSKWSLTREKTLRRGWLRAVSILITWAIVSYAVYLLMSVLVPQLIDSITTLINNAESYYNQIYDWADNLLKKNPNISNWVRLNLERYYQDALSLLTEKILPGAQQMLTSVTGGVISSILGVVVFAKNLIIGIIISVYLLAMKEQSLARCCKLLYGVLSERAANLVMRGTRRTDEIFSGFVRGKLLDSLIIGILCFIGGSILNLPYTPLVSVVVGVTNIIPFFGPFLGAIPSAFLILLVSPKQCLIFIIFVIVLQQFDGNILGPKILGSATGISSFWVVVTILLGGGFFGVLGMFLGVPVFACLQVLVKYLVDRRLRRRNMPTEAYCYVKPGPGVPATGAAVINASKPPAKPEVLMRLSKKPRRVCRPQAANQVRSFSPGACTWAKILLSLQVWNLSAFSEQIMRAADCKPFIPERACPLGIKEKHGRSRAFPG